MSLTRDEPPLETQRAPSVRHPPRLGPRGPGRRRRRVAHARAPRPLRPRLRIRRGGSGGGIGTTLSPAAARPAPAPASFAAPGLAPGVEEIVVRPFVASAAPMRSGVGRSGLRLAARTIRRRRPTVVCRRLAPCRLIARVCRAPALPRRRTRLLRRAELTGGALLQQGGRRPRMPRRGLVERLAVAHRMGLSLFSGIWMERSLGSTRDRRARSAFSLDAFSLDSLPNLVVLRSPTDRLRTLPAPACSALATGDGSSMLPKSAASPRCRATEGRRKINPSASSRRPRGRRRTHRRRLPVAAEVRQAAGRAELAGRVQRVGGGVGDCRAGPRDHPTDRLPSTDSRCAAQPPPPPAPLRRTSRTRQATSGSVRTSASGSPRRSRRRARPRPWNRRRIARRRSGRSAAFLAATAAAKAACFLFWRYPWRSDACSPTTCGFTAGFGVTFGVSLSGRLGLALLCGRLVGIESSSSGSSIGFGVH